MLKQILTKSQMEKYKMDDDCKNILTTKCLTVTIDAI